jgi:hypothetical protein
LLDVLGDNMNIDEHPDLQNLRLSGREQRKARAEARRRQRQALGMAPEPSFGQKYRTRLVVIGVLGVIVVFGLLAVDRARPGVTTTSPSTTGTVMAQAPGVDLSQPFLNTPAAGWADGAAGIVPPAPAPAGTYTAEQVGAGYERVRQLLVTARLEPAVLEGHDFERVLSMLAPTARTQFDMSHPSEQAYSIATRIADGFHLLPVAPKVTGSMSAAEDKDGALRIHTNYVFAYAFTPADPDKITDPMDIVTVDRFEADYTITDGRWAAADQGVWSTEVHYFGYSIACEAYERGELAPSYSERAPTTGEPVDRTRAFDPKSPLPTKSTCPGMDGN